jgi:hypothetical protein
LGWVSCGLVGENNFGMSLHIVDFVRALERGVVSYGNDYKLNIPASYFLLSRYFTNEFLESIQKDEFKSELVLNNEHVIYSCTSA